MSQPGQDHQSSQTGHLSTHLSAGVLLAVVLYFGFAPIAGFDLWWQLATGREMWALSSTLPEEIFSHSFAGQPWPYKDAGFSLLIWGIYDLGGLPGLIWAKAFVHVGCLVLLAAACRGRKIDAASTVVVAACVYMAAAFRLTERPQILSFALALLALIVLDRCWRQRKTVLLPRRELAFCLFICLINANVHRAALLLPIIYTGYFAALLLDRKQAGVGRRELMRSALKAGLWLVAAALCCAANPSGIAIFTTSVAMIDDPILHASIPEWWSASPSNILAAAPASFFWLAAIAACLVFPRIRRQLSLWDQALLILALLSGLRGLRFLPYLGILAGLPLAGLLSRCPYRAFARPVPQVLAPALAVLCVLWASGRGLPSPALSTLEGRYPDGAVEYIRRAKPSGALYNDFGYGGYLMFMLGRTHPAHRVYIDGRNDIIYSPAFISEYLQSKYDAETFAAIVARYDIQWLAIETAIDQGRREFLDRSRAWSLVHIADKLSIYVRNDGPNAALAHRDRYLLLKPHLLSRVLLKASQRSDLHAPLLAELDRALSAEPNSTLLRIAKARFLALLGPEHRGELETTLAELERLGQTVAAP